ncbi:hypothetical protein MtrunA17_Chr2g0285101 [Medicago truncatula]|uniref:Transmembrane protein, putative n=1 Tax=Medicago truncatula TaxID=3880 RepID=A0A072V4C0_MEDTR|nr:uncharacterized protein LOC25486036 [Medicago truncatula]KEH36677.1 transmembrane protein, putative [Medicago truncatula]RHN72199.1 hypothetical protein MtrunA17_Chr2g0285101 [Medicago truncatula]
MTTVRSNPTLIIFFFLILFITPSQSLSFSSYYRFRNFLSLSHSIFTGVANLRTKRGDIAGAERAKTIANSLEKVNGFGFVKLVWSAWSWKWMLKELPLTEMYGAVSDVNEFLRSLNELTRLESAGERAVWLSRNYQNLLTVTKSLFSKLLKAFGQSEGVRKVVETLRIEVVEGGLIRDCLLLGGNDLKDLIKVAKDLLLQFFPAATDKNPEL